MTRGFGKALGAIQSSLHLVSIDDINTDFGHKKCDGEREEHAKAASDDREKLRARRLCDGLSACDFAVIVRLSNGGACVRKDNTFHFPMRSSPLPEPQNRYSKIQN